ncbi:MAG: hypothetical protein DHS20C02_09320 [Micavibrio sp.]|nr:MAG: hypothetical protein DHS20C02_09320 [Micavibrio sp.]
MSIKYAEEKIKSFLQADESVNETPFGQGKGGVIAIKGKWGTGKTYIWNHIVDEHLTTHENFKSYAYVSLFGCKNLNDLKGLIFFKSRPNENEGSPLEYDRKASVKELQDKISSALHKAKSYPLVRTVLDAFKEFNGISTDLGLLGWLTVKDTLICIDDLERMGGGLETKDVLGLVCELKDQKNCKVALILHDEQIPAEYYNFREKIVDVEVLYAPTTEELFEKIFGMAKDEDNESILKFIHYFEIVNLRTLQKINSQLAELARLMKGVEPEVRICAIYAIVVLNAKHWEGMVEKPDSARKAVEKGLLGIEYDFTDIFKAYVEDGWFDKKEISGQLKKASDEVAESKKRKDHSREWHELGEKYMHGSLKDDEADFVNALVSHVKKGVTLSRLNYAVGLLRELEHDKEADNCIDAFIKSKSKNWEPGSEVFDDHFIRREQIDKTLEQKVQQQEALAEKKYFKSIDVQKELGKIFLDPENQIFTRDQVKFLASVDIKNFYDFVSVEISPLVIRGLKQCLEEGHTYGDLLDEHNRLKTNVTEVLKSFAAENKINALRMKWWRLEYFLKVVDEASEEASE